MDLQNPTSNETGLLAGAATLLASVAVWIRQHTSLKPIRIRVANVEKTVAEIKPRAEAAATAPEIREILDGFKSDLSKRLERFEDRMEDGFAKVHGRLDSHIDGHAK